MLERLVFTVILGYLLVVQLLNARLVEPFILELGRTRVYEQTVRSAWGLTFVLIALVFLFQVPPTAVGLTFSPEAGNERAWRWFFLSCVLISISVVFYLLVKTSPALRERLRPYYQLDLEKLLLPRTEEERKAWTGVSITAGLTEEFIFRGILIYTLTLYIDASDMTLAVIAGVLFGLAHAYQGVRGVLTTGVVGIGLGLLYLGMGVLWPVMVLHVVLDLVAGPIHVGTENE